MERSASFAARARVRIVQLVRAVPIRWRILSIALLNSAVVAVLAILIWKASGRVAACLERPSALRETVPALA